MATNEAMDEEDIEKFEMFIFEMDDVLEPFIEEAESKGKLLDYSLESLHALEAYLNEVDEPAEVASLLKNRASRYLGEVFRKNVGGRWELCADPDKLFFKLPVLVDYAQMPLEFCPIEIVANYLGSRKAGLLRGAVASHEEFKKPE